MFTGIIEETGLIEIISRGARSSVITVYGDIIFDDLKQGDSVAINGVCLTATTLQGKTFTADVMNETLERTTIGRLKAKSRVNLERAMAACGRFGGHIVTGHIDGTGKVEGITRDDNAIVYKINAQDEIMKYIVEKGSIAIDGISLTVADISSDGFKVSVIPHTSKNTTLSAKSVGDEVNLETDIIGKYVQRLMQFKKTEETAGEITPELLAKYGFMGV